MLISEFIPVPFLSTTLKALSEPSPSPQTAVGPEKQPLRPNRHSSGRDLNNLASPSSQGISPVIANRSPLSDHFKIGDQQLLTEQHETLTQEMAAVLSQQPNFKDFLQKQLALAFPQLNPVDANKISFNQFKQTGDNEQLLSSEPLMNALSRAIREIHAEPDKHFIDVPGLRSEFVTRPAPTESIQPLQTPGSLHSIARAISTQFPQALQQYWATPSTSQGLSSSPQNRLLWMHKQQLSTQAALRTMDGTLSPASKQLIDSTLRNPTLETRERALPDGSRIGVYPITLDDKTENGARLAGAFMITSKDGSSATAPTWPANGRAIELNEQNGPVVLYTPSEGFEEFATPALLRTALAQRIDNGGPKAELLMQSLPLPLQNRTPSPEGDDLMLGVEPLAGDVLAEGIPLLLKRQSADVGALLAKTFDRANAPGANPLQDPNVMAALDEAADWSSQVDGTNAMLARNEKLAEKRQPEWMKTLSPVQEAFFNSLESKAEKSAAKLAPILEKIPTLPNFSRARMNEAIKSAYPQANADADKLTVTMVTKTRFHLGRSGIAQKPSTTTTKLSLTDLALKNPSQWEIGESNKHTKTTMTLALQDSKGKPLLDDQGQPIILDTQQLKTLVNTADVGGQYTKLLETSMGPDTDSGAANDLRKAWKTSQADVMEKEAFLAQLNPDGFQARATTDTTSKRGMQWVYAVLDYPDPATRPQVDGKTIVANTLVELGQAIHGTLVIGNNTDSSLVLYTPDAPDGLAFREVADLDALKTLLDKKEWRTYIERRKSPLEKKPLERVLTSGKKLAMNGGKNLEAATDLIDVIGDRLGGPLKLKPIDKNIHDEMYSQQTRLLIDRADFQSTSSAEVSAESTRNKVMFGIEVASLFLDLIPVLGKGVSIGTRLTKGALSAVRLSTKSLPSHLLSKTGRGALFADMTASASGLPFIPRAPLRPVFKPTLAAPPKPSAPARTLLSQTSISSPTPSTSSGLRAPKVLAAPAPSAHTLTPIRDLSAYAVPEEVLKGIQPRPDGIYQVGENWYIRFTDSTGANKPYQIDSAFKARYGQVNITNPKAPVDAPKTIRNVALMQSTGSGEWRLSEMLGGRRGAQRRQSPTPPVQYLDYLFAGGADFTAQQGTRGVASRWFRNDMNAFYEQQAAGALPPRPNLQPISPSASPSDLMSSQLEKFNGVVIGEQHNQVATDLLLIKDMPMYRERGVTTILVEGAPGVGLTPYSMADVNMIPTRPRNPDYVQNTPSRAALLAAAEQNGINIVGIEHEHLTQHITRSAEDDSLNLRHTNDRQKELNYYAKKVIDQIPPGEKWIAVVGRSHMSTSRGVPGIAELTGTPAIGVYDSARGAPTVIQPSMGSRPDPAKRLTLDEMAGDYQIHLNVDQYRKPVPAP